MINETQDSHQEPVLEGDQARGVRPDGGYQPRGIETLDHRKLKPPKGGSAIELPKPASGEKR